MSKDRLVRVSTYNYKQAKLMQADILKRTGKWLTIEECLLRIGARTPKDSDPWSGWRL